MQDSDVLWTAESVAGLSAEPGLAFGDCFLERRFLLDLERLSFASKIRLGDPPG